MRRAVVSAVARGGVLALVCGLVAWPAAAQTIPRAAYQFQRPLIANARAVWGLAAPVAVLASQVHQESGWRPDAKSAFAGGLAQFTPATAADISKRYPELAGNAPFEPSWALRALARYDKELFDRQLPAASECDRWAFALAAYNGGPGWMTRDRRLAASQGADASRWWGHVERFSPRAAWAFRENREYPRRILLQRQPLYLTWGPGVRCEEA